MDVRKDIRTTADLVKLGPMDEQAMATRPVEDFVPRSLLHRRREFLIGETAGTLGQPKYAAHRLDEFHAAFVEPFVVAARRVGFPRELNWLFIGPSGPHIIGKAARACAQALASPDPFTIDLDPRWAKKLLPGTFVWRRYLDHVQDQALAIINAQRIGILFSTPIVLESLGPRISDAQRQTIRGIHLGGLSVTAAQRQSFRRHFPHAVLLSGYGNTLFGMMPELAWSDETGFSYYPLGCRLLPRVIPADSADPERLGHDVSYGQRGQVVLSRLDETQLIVNLIERDTAVRLRPPPAAASEGFVLDGLGDPQPIVNQLVKPAVGLY